MVADFAALVDAQRVSVACNDQWLIGYVVFYPVVTVMHLENVAVMPAHAGQGVGKRLIRLVEDEAVRLELTSVELYTNELMVENLAMYPSLGYQEFDRRCEDGFKRVYFRRLSGTRD